MYKNQKTLNLNYEDPMFKRSAWDSNGENNSQNTAGKRQKAITLKHKKRSGFDYDNFVK